MSLRTSLATITPRVQQDAGIVTVRTNALLRLLTLWSYDYQISFDSNDRHIEVTKRTLWIARATRRIPFDRVERIDNDYRTSGGHRRDSTPTETYRVSLILSSTGEIVPVTTFRGAGQPRRGMNLLEGAQQEESHRLVALLESILQTRSRPKQLPDPARPSGGAARSCVQCGQAAAYNQHNCLYCGGRVEARRTPLGIPVN